MVIALSIAVGGTILAVIFFAAWVIDLRFRAQQQDAELRSLRATLDRVAQDVVTLGSGDRPRLLEQPANAAPSALAADSSPTLEEDPGDSAPPSSRRRVIPPDIPTLLVRSLTGGDRTPPDASPGAALISGAQEELALVARMLLGIDTRYREAWPEPPALGNVLTALSDRLLAGLELLSHERGGAPPSSPEADDDEPPPSSNPGGQLPH